MNDPKTKSGEAGEAVRVQRLVGPHDRTIKRRLKELRSQIDNSKDPAVQRISYAMECGIRWARENTVGWEAPAVTARDLAVMLRRELKHERARLTPNAPGERPPAKDS